jgi:membrane dipeptidase
MIRACAAKGGVVGISGIGPFLGASTGLVERLLRQLRYVIDLVGPMHVGLGLDHVFDTAELERHVRAHPDRYPDGVDGGLAMVRPEEIPAIAEGLARDNMNEEQIAAVMGGNWVRIAREVWR